MVSNSNGKRKWSAQITQSSDALDLENKVFTGSSEHIAKSLSDPPRAARAGKRARFARRCRC